MLKSHKIALEPNNKQATYFAKAAGCARKAYNWALYEWGQQYQRHKTNPMHPKPSEAGLRRQLNAIKREQFPWMLDVTKNAPQMAIIQLGDAFKNFFSGRASYPKVRKKWIDDRFTLTNDQFKVDGSRIRIPRLGWVRMRETLRFTGKIVSATISRQADRWYVSLTVETLHLPIPKTQNQGAVGVDLGITALATLSTGESVIGPKPHKALLNRVRRLSRRLSRKKKGSSNRKKARQKLARLHARIAHIRHDSLHKLTTKLTSSYYIIGIEDLHVKGMMKNRCLARSVADMGFYEFRRQLDYKAGWQGCVLVVANRWFASSKICSRCKYQIESLPLSVREWVCPKCRTKHHRDLNSAINLEEYAVSSTVSACGEESAGSQSLD
jgi:putative transposase